MNDNYYFNIKKKRPEEIYKNASDYFKGETLNRYATSKSMIRIQERLTIRALELLNLQKKDALILDAGSGPGFAAMYLKERGYNTVTLDIITEFLNYYDIKDLNPITSDMCFPPFRSNTFDAIISISALQWVYRKLSNKIMQDLLTHLAKSFYIILKPRTKLVFQFYPKSKEVLDSISRIFLDVTKFTGNVIIDNPNSAKKRKVFLVLEKLD
ncbi:MAG: methyltransferase domain-containing protein [Promethearchaeota archaeon]|nr:MAG: methyltransferase domain-containing protein [Candidatus Lokiarchaeota archaeon]